MAEQQTILRNLRLMRTLRKRPMTIAQMLDLLRSDGVTHRRTVYRCLETFEDLGLKLKKVGRTYLIEDTNADRDFSLDDLTTKELDLIRSSLSAFDSPLVPMILQKLEDNTQVVQMVDSMVRQQAERNIEQLKLSIKQNFCVRLHRYQSLKSDNKISNYTIEPKELQKGGKLVYAYNLANDKMQKFSTDRIESVEILRGQMQTHEKAFEHSDVFGYDHTEARALKLRLTERAMLIMREEFPRSDKYIRDDGGNYWVFEHIYCNPQKPDALIRFILSLPKDIEILVPNDLKVLIRAATEGVTW